MVLMGILFRKYISSVIRQKEDLKADVDRKTKHAKFSGKTNISYTLYAHVRKRIRG